MAISVFLLLNSFPFFSGIDTILSTIQVHKADRSSDRWPPAFFCLLSWVSLSSPRSQGLRTCEGAGPTEGRDRAPSPLSAIRNSSDPLERQCPSTCHLTILLLNISLVNMKAMHRETRPAAPVSPSAGRIRKSSAERKEKLKVCTYSYLSMPIILCFFIIYISFRSFLPGVFRLNPHFAALSVPKKARPNSNSSSLRYGTSASYSPNSRTTRRTTYPTLCRTCSPSAPWAKRLPPELTVNSSSSC